MSSAGFAMDFGYGDTIVLDIVLVDPSTLPFPSLFVLVAVCVCLYFGFGDCCVH